MLFFDDENEDRLVTMKLERGLIKLMKIENKAEESPFHDKEGKFSQNE